MEKYKEEAYKNQIVTPWIVDSRSKDGIDYDKLINEFGTESITDELLNKFTKITGYSPHIFLKRKLFFSHRDFNKLLDEYVKGVPLYIYTGRGPSGNIHMGNKIIFDFTVWLQKVFNNSIVIIQMADDEKFYFKDISLEEAYNLGFENAKDIIACGFDINRTFIFSNLDYNGFTSRNRALLMKKINVNMLNSTYGFGLDSNIGMLQWPIHEIVPCMPSSFPFIFGNNNKAAMCLVPCAIDQDLFFRTFRDFANGLGCYKPCLIHSKFLVSLQGIQKKMSTSSNIPTAIFLNDSDKMIHEKIIKHAFSGGGNTLKEHKTFGCNLLVDVSYQYLLYFEEDEDKLNEITLKYGKGIMSTNEVKLYLINKLILLTEKHKKQRNEVTDDIVKKFYDIEKFKLNN